MHITLTIAKLLTTHLAALEEGTGLQGWSVGDREGAYNFKLLSGTLQAEFPKIEAVVRLRLVLPGNETYISGAQATDDWPPVVERAWENLHKQLSPCWSLWLNAQSSPRESPKVNLEVDPLGKGDECPPEGTINSKGELWDGTTWIGKGKEVNGKVWTGTDWLTPLVEWREYQERLRWRKPAIEALKRETYREGPPPTRGVVWNGAIWTGEEWLGIWC